MLNKKPHVHLDPILPGIGRLARWCDDGNCDLAEALQKELPKLSGDRGQSCAKRAG